MIKLVKNLAFSVVGFLLLMVLFMAIFRICPPFDFGPQPPWCLNPERFERDFNTDALSGHFRSYLIDVFPTRQRKESIYQPELDDFDYINLSETVNDYKISFGIAPSDFFWPVCLSAKSCVNPEANVVNTFSRINSLGSDFIVFTDYARINGKRDIYEDRTALSRKQIKLKLDTAEKYNLTTMLLINIFVDETTGRHTSLDSDLETNRVFGSSIQRKIFDSWSPDEKTMHLFFDNWDPIALEKAKKWQGLDYIIINPEDMHFHFLTHPYIMNRRNNRLIEETRKVFDGKVCVHFKDLSYIEQFDELDYYKNADCIILGGHPGYGDYMPDKSVESFEEFYEQYFMNDFFSDNQNIPIYQMISTMSYDKYVEDRWFEVGDYEVLELEYERDFELQANSFEGFFRAIQKVQPPIAGIFHYGYWWTDINFDEPDKDKFNVQFMNSIRNKDAEHIFYKWNRIFND